MCLFKNIYISASFLQEFDFPYAVIEWNGIDLTIANVKNDLFFFNILKFSRPHSESVYDCHSPKGVEFVA